MQKAGLQRSPAFCLLISLFRVCELSLYQTAPYRDSNAQSVGTALAAVRSRIYNKLGQRALFLLQRRFLRAFQQMHTEFLCVKPILLYEHPAKEVLLFVPFIIFAILWRLKSNCPAAYRPVPLPPNTAHLLLTDQRLRYRKSLSAKFSEIRRCRKIPTRTAWTCRLRYC